MKSRATVTQTREEAELTRYLLDHSESVPCPDVAAIPPQYSHEALALRFTAKHADNLRYTATWGKWFIWDGNRWHKDDTWRVFELARMICREASSEYGEERFAVKVASADTIAAVERLARADRCHAATVNQWDSDPWQLNTPAGMVDLRTGELRSHHREDYATKAAGCAPDPGADCPLWLSFLRRITADGPDLQDFLQRVAGCSLTGITHEHAMFFCTGPGPTASRSLLEHSRAFWEITLKQRPLRLSQFPVASATPQILQGSRAPGL